MDINKGVNITQSIKKRDAYEKDSFDHSDTAYGSIGALCV